LRDCCPDTKILVLSSRDYGKTVKEALQAGANGFVVKNESFGEVVQAIRSVMDGRRYISQQIRERRKHLWRTTGETHGEDIELT
ncbi:MAG: response regulator transcription factor, partial [Gammaproteobacteria bacterium]|nr:response regulator transcription factor [Gammaproteobacteria bacterium]NIW45126.1 DNA-binding response regulator [Gammaproteobacteria bacterium]